MKNYIVPHPILNKKENDSLNELSDKYEKLIKPGIIGRAGQKLIDVIPDSVKAGLLEIKENLSGAEFYEQCMKVVADGFGILEKYAAKATVSESYIVKKVASTTKQNNITCLDEVCFARSYNLSKLVADFKKRDLGLALLEGGVTGYFGFAGLPFNLVLSTFLYYRAVQSVAMYYGYDVKNDSSELVIASDVFTNALSPKSKGSSEIGGIVGKVMVMTETTTIKQASKKTWEEMAARGGVTLLLTRMRALAHKSAQKALERAGEKGLEESMFKGILEQLGKNLSKKTIGKAIPFIGLVVGGLFDTSMMNTIIDYADVFYNKRFLLEKEVRINSVITGDDDVIDLDPEDYTDLNME